MKWKGKNVSKAHYFHLRNAVEYRLINERRNWGFMYSPPSYEIGGKKNGKHIRNGVLWNKK